jgi:hypothetical protein
MQTGTLFKGALQWLAEKAAIAFFRELFGWLVRRFLE